MPTRKQITRRHLAEFRLAHGSRDLPVKPLDSEGTDNVLGTITLDREARELKFTPAPEKPSEDAKP
jgi:hypothetical protein